jgi:hypothetical protein
LIHYTLDRLRSKSFGDAKGDLFEEEEEEAQNIIDANNINENSKENSSEYM